MRLSAIVATLEGCPFDLLDDPDFINRLLEEAVAAGHFKLLHTHIHRFEPQGVTGAAVLSESHVAVHSWPEEGVLFVDIATCSTHEATEAAFERICELLPHAVVHRRQLGYVGPQAEPRQSPAWKDVQTQNKRTSQTPREIATRAEVRSPL